VDINGLLADVAAPVRRWKIWFLMANQDISLRYRRSVLGPIWISLAMASLVLGLSILYSEVFRVDFHDYIVYIGCGFLAWFLIAGMISEGAMAVIEAEGQLRSLPLPIPLLVTRVVYRNLIMFVHNLVVVGILLVIMNFRPGWEALLAIPALVLYAITGLLLGVILAPIAARFRDVPQVLTNILQIMFFLTPLFWLPSQTSDRRFFVDANPFYHLVELIRGPLLGETPALLSWGFTLLSILVLGLLAFWTLAVSRRRVFLWL